jgi:hypothetical protein
MRTPTARGPFSAAVLDALTTGVVDPALPDRAAEAAGTAARADLLTDDDVQIALTAL